MMERADAQGIKTYVGRCYMYKMYVNCKDIRDIQGRSCVKYVKKKKKKNCNLTGMS